MLSTTNIRLTPSATTLYVDIRATYPVGVTSLGSDIATARTAAGLTQTQVGVALGLGQGVVSKWEKNRQRPTVDHLVPLAKLLRVSVNQLFVGLDPTYDAITSDPTGHASTADSGHSSGGSTRGRFDS